ncbi:MAG: hypothetical protein DSZ24_00435 [Thermodesulfatator sp.]|nr:MAG: hypothetical protein DSZ24_00435 [Thermodesulfatator sp.]
MSPPKGRRRWDIWFQEIYLKIERALYVLVAIGLILATLEVIYDGYHALFQVFGYQEFTLGVLRVIDRFLIALMFLEILYTIQIIFGEEYHLQCVEPFLMVAIIALVRRLLILSFEISHTQVSHERLKLYLVEMALVGSLILALVGAVILLRLRRRGKNAP